MTAPGPAGAAAENAAALAMMVEAMTGAVALARALVLVGRRIDLEGLDREIGEMCAEAIELPREHGRPLLPPLVALHAEVDALIGELRAREPIADA